MARLGRLAAKRDLARHVLLSETSSLNNGKIHLQKCFFRSQGHRDKNLIPELYPQRLILPENHGYVPTLSPAQVKSLFAINEAAVDTSSRGQSPVIAFESNQLSSNHPIEDRRAVARLQQTNGTLFAVFDGHAGMACAQASSERLFDYIAISLLSPTHLEKYSHSLKTDTPMSLLQWYQFNNDYINEDMSVVHRNSLQKYVIETLSTFMDEEEDGIDGRLKNAFRRLDNDFSSEALPSAGRIDFDALEVALSGACACVAHIQDTTIKVANVGDTRAVIGQLDEHGQWKAKPLSVDHNVDNKTEVDRVKSQHPRSEHSFILRNNRLLGQLIPLRAFGDVRYKWSLKDLKSIVNLMDSAYAPNIIPTNYYTPPYLIAEPEVITHQLTQNDRFLVLASDGIWEMMSNNEVINLVGTHLQGRQTQDTFKLEDNTPRTLGSINQTLQERKFGLAHKTSVANGATHLLQHALGPEHRKLSEMLTLPRDVCRYYRDDMTIIIVYFDTQYLAGVN